jgi:hypothetical protein
MEEMEKAVLDGKKEGHKAVVAIVAELNRLGYLIGRAEVNPNSGGIEITCYPPLKEEGNNKD